MGRNFTSVCHTCKAELMHLRGKENEHIHDFADDHIGHHVEILDDYANSDLPEYEDMFDFYNPDREDTE